MNDDTFFKGLITGVGCVLLLYAAVLVTALVIGIIAAVRYL